MALTKAILWFWWKAFTLSAAIFFCANQPLFALGLKEAFLKGPYLQGPAETEMTVMWESATNFPGLVHFGLNETLDQQFRLQVPAKVNGLSRYSVTNIDASGKRSVKSFSFTNIVYLYEVTLTNLQPASVYSYSVEIGEARSPLKHFKTFGAHPAKVTFVAYGDTRSHPTIHSNIVRNFKRFSPEFILHTGDLVADGRRYDLWGREFFAPLAAVIDEVPILPAIGNHEEDAKNYFRYLHLPGNKRWYSFDAGPVHVLCLDYHFPKDSPTNAQLRFAREDLLASKAPWKIIMLHYPVYNVGGHDTSWGHKGYLPLFHEAKVDLVIAGHSHLYERFKPIGPKNNSPNDWPITHITTGGGGADLVASQPHPALACRASTNHYMIFEVSTDTLRGQALTAQGHVLDSFELIKAHDKWPDDFLAQVYSEELMNVSCDASTNLLGKFTAAPTPTEPGNMMLTLLPAPNSNPVQLEISIAASSAANYILEGGPLRCQLPPQGGSNQVVWAKVRATGKKKVSGKIGEDLSPSLYLEAIVTCEFGASLAHGTKCRVSKTAADAFKKLSKSP